MPRGAKGAKPGTSRVEAELAAVRKSLKDEAARRRQLEKRLADAQEQQTAAAYVPETRSRELAEAHEQQAATSEILQVISSSPTDTQPVFDTIARSAVRLCDGVHGAVLLLRDGLLHLVAHHNVTPEGVDALRRVYPIPAVAESSVGRAILSRDVDHVADADATPPGGPTAHVPKALGYRSQLSIPLLREGTPIGVIAVARREPGLFPAAQVGLLRIFAAQALIAIENVRLFNETKEALEEQTATAEILGVIASSPTDVQPVFAAMLASAARLCDASDATIFQVEGDQLRIVAHEGPIPVTPVGTLPLIRGTAAGRAVLERRTIHVHDLQAESDEYPESSALARSYGFRTALNVPLLRGAEAIGTVSIRRTEARPFTDRQIALLETFAAQAVIAIENVRLFTELQVKNRAVTEAHAQVTETLDQQTATSEILRAISSSPADVQPVFETIASSAARLFSGLFVAVLRYEGGLIHLAAQRNFSEEGREAAASAFPLSPTRENPSGWVILERRPLNVPDIVERADFQPVLQRALGYRSYMAVPMLREDQSIGAIAVTRGEVKPFSEREVALLQTFADQAVIAIENARMFQELQARNRELTEALERQTATADILRVISSSPTDLQPVLDSVSASAARLSNADDGSIFLAEGNVLRLVARQMVAHHGSMQAPGVGEFTIPIARGTVGGRAALNRQIVHVQDLQAADSDFPEGAEYARQLGQRAQLAVPLLREGAAIGVLQVRRSTPVAYTEAQTALLQTFADQAVIAIENVRLFTELGARNRELTESLEQQTATAEILRVIASSPTELQPVMEAVAENAARVCGATDSSIFRLEGEHLRLVARHGSLRRPLTIGDTISAGGGTVGGRVVRDRRTIQVENILAAEAEFPETVSRGREAGSLTRTILATPLLREGTPLGVILISRGPDVHPFSTKQIALLETFANQAVIAIENVRLFTELQARNRDLVATSEILQVISRSPTDAKPVFETIIRSAVALCEAVRGNVYRFDGRLLHHAAQHGMTSEALEASRRDFPRPPSRGIVTGRAILTRTVVHIDVSKDPEYELGGVVQAGFRTLLAVPMLRDDEAIGTIVLDRAEDRPFSDRQIALLQTFADQAVIAIENVRLFTELEARNRELTETLEQQTATSQILRVISSSPTDLRPVLDAVAENAARVCGANDALIFRVEGNVLRLAATYGAMPASLPVGEAIPITRGSLSGRAVQDRRAIHVEDVMTAEGEFPETVARIREAGYALGTNLVTPLLREGVPLGTIVIRRTTVQPFTEKQVALLQTFADQAVIAIENVRLFKELEARNRELTETLEQQTATSEILRVIASSPTDLGPVMQAVAENAARVCGAADASISLLDGERVRLVTHHGSLPRIRAIGDTFPLSRDYVTGRAMIDRRTIHVEDMLAAEAEFPDFVFRMRQAGIATRTLMATPLLREGAPLGAIIIARPEVHPFSAKQIALLETFANQAVIAIENVRLFQELRARTAELTRSVAQLTALGEVSRAVSSTLDVEAVLETIVSRSSQLAGADACTIYEYDEGSEQFHLRATHNFDPKIAESMRAMPLRKGEGVTGRATALRQPVQVSDISETRAYQSSFRDALIAAGYRAVLSVPLLREDQIIGSLSLARKTPGEFPPEVVELLKTFATQSALAIQNARLFREIADKSRQLEAASRHKSEFLASMSHELRTPLNAILGFNEMILGEVYGALPPDLREPLTDIQNSGKHLLRLINNVLDLSKIEAGRMELAPTDYAVQDIVERVRASLHPLAAEKGLEFVVSAPEDIPLAHGDSGRITQCLLNLAGNALKFTRHGRVEISVAREGDRLVYRVADTGIGIAKDRLETLFTEFRQGDATITSEFGGTGLGLSITKRFVEMHGGRIWVETEPGKGSTFFFEVPLRLAGGETAA